MAPGLCDAHQGLTKQLDRIESKVDKLLQQQVDAVQVCARHRGELEDAMTARVDALRPVVQEAIAFKRQALWSVRVLSALGGLVLFGLALLRYAGPLGRLLVSLSGADS